MKTLYQTIIHAALAVCLFILFQKGCNQPAPPSPVTSIEIIKWKDKLVIQKDSSAANYEKVKADRPETIEIEKLVKGDSWPYMVKDSAFCDSSIRHLLGAVEHLEKQVEIDSTIKVTLESIVSVQDSVINQQGKQIAKGEKAIKQRNRWMAATLLTWTGIILTKIIR